ncbi:hypothetical protein HGP28_02120 [Vibrio sp. SM6]|uniref:Aldose 1-epimerase n=1 Tax=Vibrio agarilyticus TaxID=2726741 RepID=A0A7X8TN86_9VIBR|nr:hypothetical protein [Vibrio agarilyticus]NLS11685.1 hypothetical protein [Vibrio agarilyticus]
MIHFDNSTENRQWGHYTLYTLKNDLGTKVEISDLGAAIINFWVRDRDHRVRNIVLGYNDSASYLNSSSYLSGVIPSQTVKNQYAELHKSRWTLVALAAQHITLETSLVLNDHATAQSIASPQAITVMVTYRLSDDNELTQHIWAEPNFPCSLDITSHSYFNLLGRHHDITDHIVNIDADLCWPLNTSPQEALPSMDVAADFKQPKSIRIGIAEQVRLGQPDGYAQNYRLNGHGLRTVCWVFEPTTGLSFELLSDKSAVQFNTGRHLQLEQDDYAPYSGFCFEPMQLPTQSNFANGSSPKASINHLDCGQSIADGIKINESTLAVDNTAALWFDENRPYSSTTIYKVQVEPQFSH